MKKWHIVVDVDKCIGCFNCFTACKDEHVGNDWAPYTDAQARHNQNWIAVDRSERGTYPHADIAYKTHMCNHCSNPPCSRSAPGVMKKRQDGIVQMDMAMAKDNKELVKACPYGHISWNEEIGAAQKCTFCAHLIDQGWKEPRCVQACPLRALRVVHCEDHEFDELVKEKGLRAAVPEASKPRIYYKNLHRIDRLFIAGSIVYKNGAEDVCAKGVKVELVKDGQTVATATADTYGDFRFDDLQPDSGEYTVNASDAGKGSLTAKVKLGRECADIGTVFLKS